MNHIFICYSHRDEKYKDQLIRHLKSFSNNFDIWHDRLLTAGDIWKPQIIDSINNASAAVILISADFLISKFIQDEELPRLFDKKSTETFNVFPLLIQACNWEENSFIQKTLLRPTDGKPLASFSTKSKKETILADFAKEIKNRMISAPITDQINSISDAENQQSDKTKPILDQIYSYLELKYKEITFYPSHLLVKNYPFKNKESFTPYYNNYYVNIDNKSVFEFFKSLEIGDSGALKFLNNEYIEDVVDYDRKTREILSKLNANLIHGFVLGHGHEPISIKTSQEGVCTCAKCSFINGKISQAIKKLKEPSSTIQEKFKLAFVNYNLGNFISSAKLLLEIVKESEEHRLKTTSFIASYNLSKLKLFINNYYLDIHPNTDKGLIPALEQIDLNKQFGDLDINDDKNLLEWIKDNSFYTEALESITSTVSKIRDHYYSQLNGGWNSNNYISELVNEFNNLEAFLVDNNITYTNFSEFDTIADLFVEGLFASHAIKEPQSRLGTFSEFLINKIIFYSKADTITKYFRRYELNEIVYKSASMTGQDLHHFTTIFLRDIDELKTQSEANLDAGNQFLWQRYNRIFGNLMTIISLTNLPKEQINSIANDVLEFISKDKFLFGYYTKYINTFIARKGKILDIKILKAFIITAITNREVREEIFFETIVSQIYNHHKPITLTDSELDLLDKAVFHLSLSESKLSEMNMIYLYQIIKDKKGQNRIKNSIKAVLKEKFNPELYSQALTMNVIDFDRKDWNQLINSDELLIKATPTHFFRRDYELRNRKLERVINLGFKLDIKMDSQFDKFRNVSPFYDWLLDMENFDYNKFDAKWIKEIGTRFFYRKIKQYPIIQQLVSEYLGENNDPLVQKIYMRHLTS